MPEGGLTVTRVTRSRRAGIAKIAGAAQCVRTWDANLSPDINVRRQSTLAVTSALCNFNRSNAMARRVVHSNSAPTPVGPYSQAVVLDGWIWTSGQVALDPTTGKVVGHDAAAQADRTLQNIKAIPEAGGSSLAQVVRAAVHLTNMDDFAAVDAVYPEYFPSAYPARVCVEVSRVPLDAWVEMDVTARVP